MGLFNIEKQDSFSYLVYKIDHEDRLDNITLGMILNNKITGLVPSFMNQIDDKFDIRYNITGYVNLTEYFSRVINKSLFLTTLKSIADTVIRSEDYAISAESFVLDPNMIYVDPKDCSIKLVCLPIVAQPYGDGHAMLSGIIFNNINTVYDESESLDYVHALIAYLHEKSTFSFSRLKTIIAELMAINQGDLAEENKINKWERLQSIVGNNSNLESISNKVIESVGSKFENNPLGEVIKNKPVVEYAIPGMDSYVEKPKKKKTLLGSDPDKKDLKTAEKELKKQKKEEEKIKKKLEKEELKAKKIQEKEELKAKKIQEKEELKAKKYQKKIAKKSENKHESNDEEAIIGSRQADMNAAVFEKKPIKNQFYNPASSQDLKPENQFIQNSYPEMPEVLPIIPIPELYKDDLLSDLQDAKKESDDEIQEKHLEEPLFGNEDMIDDDEPTLLKEEPTIARNYPSLIRKKMGETIPINKDVFVIGRRKAAVDYYIGDNVWVSREHIKIIKKDNSYYAIDTNSKNGSYLDEEFMKLGREYLLKDGMTIKIADEEFLFIESN